jgi:hypothetical protein
LSRRVTCHGFCFCGADEIALKRIRISILSRPQELSLFYDEEIVSLVRLEEMPKLEVLNIHQRQYTRRWMRAPPMTLTDTLLPSPETNQVFGGSVDDVWDWLSALLVDVSESKTLRKLQNLRQIIVSHPQPYKGPGVGARKRFIRVLAAPGDRTAIIWTAGYTEMILEGDRVYDIGKHKICDLVGKV